MNCLLGYGKNKNNLTCVKCPQFCMSCNSLGICYQCFSNYVINSEKLISSINKDNETCILNYCPDQYLSDSLQCISCRLGCRTCQIDGSCLSCINNFTLISSVCVDANCLSLFCFSNGSLNTCDGSLCRTCSVAANNCTSCVISALTTNQKYLKYNLCVLDCGISYFKDSLSLSCRKCDPKCATCTLLQ
jgi:hypothetical protein